MTFLNPLAFLWLATVPVLLWLWRLASTHRQVRVPSLVPFEHLLRRAPRRRTRLVVNLLFWLQLAALLGSVLALARPQLIRSGSRTTLVILDTSASMAAGARGRPAFDAARQAMLSRLARKAPSEQWLLMTTAPVSAATPEPTSDDAQLRRALESSSVSHLGGNLAMTLRLGRTLLGRAPDQVLVATDEERPSDVEQGQVRWVHVGMDLPNVAIVGLEAQGPLCRPSETRAIVTIQNFSTQPARVSVAALQRGHRLAAHEETLAPHARTTVSLALPEAQRGWVELAVDADGDGLDVDNHAWLRIEPAAILPVVVRTIHPAFQRTMARWLDACESLQWSTQVPEGSRPWLLITDQETTDDSPAAVMRFTSPAQATPIRSHWIADVAHPVGAYLPPIGTVAVPLDAAAEPPTGAAVIAAVLQGRRVPVVVADEQEGHRVVWMRFDPSGLDATTPVLVVFFNSLRWLMGQTAPALTGDPLLVPGFARGTVRITRPDGGEETLESDGGLLRYEATTIAGVYRGRQGATTFDVAVNFVDPLESNLQVRASTWRAPQSDADARATPRRSKIPLADWLLLAALIVLLIEWRLYRAKTT